MTRIDPVPITPPGPSTPNPFTVPGPMAPYVVNEHALIGAAMQQVRDEPRMLALGQAIDVMRMVDALSTASALTHDTDLNDLERRAQGIEGDYGDLARKSVRNYRESLPSSVPSGPDAIQRFDQQMEARWLTPRDPVAIEDLFETATGSYFPKPKSGHDAHGTTARNEGLPKAVGGGVPTAEEGLKFGFDGKMPGAASAQVSWDALTGAQRQLLLDITVAYDQSRWDGVEQVYEAKGMDDYPGDRPRLYVLTHILGLANAIPPPVRARLTDDIIALQTRLKRYPETI